MGWGTGDIPVTEILVNAVLHNLPIKSVVLVICGFRLLSDVECCISLAADTCIIYLVFMFLAIIIAFTFVLSIGKVSCICVRTLKEQPADQTKLENSR